MSRRISRRSFLEKSMGLSAGAALGFGFEEKALLAQTGDQQAKAVKKPSVSSKKGMPMGKIGNLQVSRLICGGNLISGFAHDRDLLYVSSLLKHYFTDEKVMETLQLCEEQGINTAILRVDVHTLRIINKYWHERGGNIQWIAQIKKISEEDMSEIPKAIDNGALGAYVHGGVADKCASEGRIDFLAKALEVIRENGVIAGIAGHLVDVPIECEKAGLKPDFYMKTLNSKSYWSAGPMPRHDSVWAETPKKTIKFMQKVEKPWIAYKVLGAGAIDPNEGFQYAYENGADFLCVGMFDFQVVEDVGIAKNILSQKLNRERPWRG